MKTVLLALSLSLAASSAALACTAEDLQAKATEVSTKMQALAAKNPQKASEIGAKLASVQSTQTTDLEGACKVYDELSAELEKAE
ncbi:hypothetical protein H7Q97_10060 [Ochrobactrum sp. CM-21-5]|nr:hypothetical protein [Ochrobactrum sp. CM-21-5]MBC2885749.1 hypothetical protein [Ochrobactrum sp. CM-21-5]